MANSEDALGQVRTYGSLVESLLGTIKRGRAEGLHQKSIVVRARILAAENREEPCVVRTVELTPYATQSIGDDARRAGRGARVELVVPQSATDVEVAWVAAQFAWLDARGIAVVVHRDTHPTQSPPTNSVGP